MSIVVVGSVAFDSVKTPFGSREQALGGAANYFAMSARFFSSVNMVGIVGDDFPEDHLQYLQANRVNLDGLERVPGASFHWKGDYGFDLNEARTLDTQLNVFADFKPKLPDSYRAAKTVFLANIDPDLQVEVLEQVHSPNLVALDTMNFWIEGKREALLRALKRVDVLLINDAEVRMLAQEHNVVKAVKIVREMGPKSIVVKRGEYGSLLFHDNEVFVSSAYPLEDVFDPTGAGDTFAGGFVGWLDKMGKIDMETMKQAMLLGTVMSSYVIEDFSFDRMRELTHAKISERFEHLTKLGQMPQNVSLELA